MMNKRGIELAASFIVVLIISIIMLGLAGGITYKVFCASGQKIADLDAQTASLVEQRLSSGARVTIPVPAKSIEPVANFCGEDSIPAATFALGIRNDFLEEEPFAIACEYKGIEGQLGEGPPFSGCANVQYTQDVTLGSKEKATRLIIITVPSEAETGKHIFTFTVTSNRVEAGDNFYGAANVYVSVV